MALSSALYDHATPTATTCTAPGSSPVARDSTTHAPSATSAAARRVAAVTRPVTTGLSARPTATSRRASSQSLDQPTESWPVRTASATSVVVRAPAPMPAESARANAVTITVGGKWLATTRPRTSLRERPVTMAAT